MEHHLRRVDHRHRIFSFFDMEHACIQKESLEKCMSKMDEHINDNSRHVEGVRIELQVMRENHLAHIQRATEAQATSAVEQERRLASMDKTIATSSTNLEWLMRYHWLVATSSIGALVVGVLGLITG